MNIEVLHSQATLFLDIVTIYIPSYEVISLSIDTTTFP